MNGSFLLVRLNKKIKYMFILSHILMLLNHNSSNANTGCLFSFVASVNFKQHCSRFSSYMVRCVAEIRAAISHIVQSEYHKCIVIPTGLLRLSMTPSGASAFCSESVYALIPLSTCTYPCPQLLPRLVVCTFDKSFISRVKQVMHHSFLWWWRHGTLCL